jgi:hypothetical protein
MRKAKDIKLKSNKSTKVSADMVAEAVGCTPNFVRKVWQGKRGKRATETQENIEVATMYLEHGNNQLLQEVKKILA